MSEYLNSPELHVLTGFARCNSQANWLTNKGIPHRLDGKRIIVSRDHVKGWIEGRTYVVSGGLNFGAIK